MSDQEGITRHLVKTQEEGMELIEKLANIASNEMVYSAPATYGEHTVITASEVMSGLGFGFGGGGMEESKGPVYRTGDEPLEKQEPEERGSGMGGGGGGYSAARPVAVVTVGPDGVSVKPVVDFTKLGIAFLTTGVAIMAAISRITRDARYLK